MDSSPDWATSALFSPSKARAHQAQARDWALVDAWLSKTYYPKRTPPFERTAETLEILLNIANLNETADEQNALTERVEKSALLSFTKRKLEHDVYSELLSGLDEQGKTSLHALAASAVMLRSVEPVPMAEQLCAMTTTHFEARQQQRRAETSFRALKSEQSRLESIVRALSNHDLQPSHNLGQRTVDSIRDTKHLKAKIAEYEERLNMRSSAPDGTSIEDFIRRTADIKLLTTRADHIDADMSKFRDLPADGRNAQAELNRARDRLQTLTLKHDVLATKLATQR